MSRAWREISADHRYRSWRAFRKWYLEHHPSCQLRLDGCTVAATQIDHIIPVSVRRDLVMVPSNCRAACAHCNHSRGATPDHLLPRQAAPSRDW